MTPFYTGLGDSGKTGFLGEGRISKSSERIEAVGTVDEATAALGLARALTESPLVQDILLKVQKQLYLLDFWIFVHITSQRIAHGSNVKTSP